LPPFFSFSARDFSSSAASFSRFSFISASAFSRSRLAAFFATGRLLQSLGELLLLLLVQLELIRLELGGELLELLLGLFLVALFERLTGFLRQVVLLQLGADLLHRLVERFFIELAGLLQLLIELRHPAERLVAIDALVLQVLDELVEVLHRSLHVVVGVRLILQLIGEVGERLEIVGIHLERVDRERLRLLHVLADLEGRDERDDTGEREDRDDVTRHRERHSARRFRAIGVRDAVDDRGAFELAR
jgi:hypothetical protein